MVNLVLGETKKPKSNRKTAQELKMYFLEQSEELLKQYIDAATGKAELQSSNTAAREEVWNLLKDFMLKSSDKLEIKINEAEDVIEAVASGRCTFEEGQKLLNLFKQVKEINQEEVGAMGGSTGITVNVLTADQASAAFEPAKPSLNQPSIAIEHEKEDKPKS